MPDMPDFDEPTLARLARDMALNVKNVHTIFAEYGIDEQLYYELMAHNEFFRKLRTQYKEDWITSTSTAERIKVGSLASLEVLLPLATIRAQDEDKPEPLAAINGLLGVLTKTAGIGDSKPSPNASERFVITINLGADVEHYDKSIEVNPNDTPPGADNGKIIDAAKEEPLLQFVRAPREGDGA
jgi:hypothetical protein